MEYILVKEVSLFMTNTSFQEGGWLARLRQPSSVSSLPESFLSNLVAELDDDTVIAIILHGSYAHGDATPYSDVDITRIVKEGPDPLLQKRFIIRDNYLVSVSTRTIEQYRQRFRLPQEAIFAVPTVRHARVLLERNRTFNQLQQEAQAFRWEPLQNAANLYANHILLEYTEYVLKIVRALFLRDTLALSEMAPALVMAMTDAMAVQRGIFMMSGNTYFRQVQESIGLDSPWTSYHRRAAGIDTDTVTIKPLEARGFAALHLYRETVQLLHSCLCSEHREVIELSVALIQRVLANK